MPFEIESVHLGEIKVIVPKVFGDHRGFFMESYRKDLFADLGIPYEFVQDNHSRSAKGVIRGLHFQVDPPMAKLMRVTLGTVFLVAVDIRRGSPDVGPVVRAGSFRRESSVRCSAPPGFARGFCVLSDVAELQYKCTAIYNPPTEDSILWSDPDIGIEWPAEEPDPFRERRAGADARAVARLPMRLTRWPMRNKGVHDTTGTRHTRRHRRLCRAAGRPGGRGTFPRRRPTSSTLSSIGLGTYLGQPDDATDSAYQAAIERALDAWAATTSTPPSTTASSAASAPSVGHWPRPSSVVMCSATKSSSPPKAVLCRLTARCQPIHANGSMNITSSPGWRIRNEFAANYQHCLAPDFLDAMIETSRRNLGVETIDIYYLHNPETQHISNTHETFRRRMLDAFETLEAAVERGEIAMYGLATWTAFRSPPNTPDYLSLTEMVGLAFEVAGDEQPSQVTSSCPTTW